MAAKRMMFFMLLEVLMAALPHARLEGFWVETSWWNNATCEDPKASPSMVSVRREIVLDGETCKSFHLKAAALPSRLASAGRTT